MEHLGSKTDPLDCRFRKHPVAAHSASQTNALRRASASSMYWVWWPDLGRSFDSLAGNWRCVHMPYLIHDSTFFTDNPIIHKYSCRIPIGQTSPGHWNVTFHLLKYHAFQEWPIANIRNTRANFVSFFSQAWLIYLQIKHFCFDFWFFFQTKIAIN